MSETNYPGIDYSHGQSNFDKSNGIHFGVICINDLNEWAWDSFEPDYGDPHCPKCGNDAIDLNGVTDDVDRESYAVQRHACCDYACDSCKIIFGGEMAYGDEPCGLILDDEEYKAFVDSHNDVMILKSPYYTHAQFCSPCAPGAGHLANPCPAGPKTYCFGHDWFDGDKAPYPVYSVVTGQLVVE